MKHLSRQHGGQIHAIMANFPDAPTPYIDLSTGISPYPYPFKQPERSLLRHLPQEDEEEALKEAACDLWHVPAEKSVTLAPGSQLLISLLPSILDVQRSVILSPTYSGHQLSWNRTVPCKHVHTIDDLFKASIQPHTLCVLCNPNNPDGRYYSPETIRRLTQQCAASSSSVLIDEAYGDFFDSDNKRPSPSAAQITLRSFGKTYGLPGLRLGFMIAIPALCARMEKLIGPWSVSTPALSIGRQALSDHPWLRRTQLTVEENASKLNALLKDYHFEVVGSGKLFTLISVYNAYNLWRHLAHCGIVARYFPEHPTYLRFGLPGTAANFNRLEAALASYSHSALCNA